VASAGLYASLHLIPDSHANIPTLSFLQAGCPSCCPTNSVKALKAISKPLKSLGASYIVIVDVDIHCVFNVDNGAGTSERRDSCACQEPRCQYKVVRLANTDEILLWSQECRCPSAVEYSHGQCQVQLRLWISRRTREAGADTTHGPLLPHYDSGSWGPTRRITVWWADVLMSVNVARLWPHVTQLMNGSVDENTYCGLSC